MKLKDLAFIGAVVLLLAPFFLSNDLYAAYLACNASHPYLMALLKFGILSTAGEVIGLRIKTGRYNEPGFGILPHAVVWGCEASNEKVRVSVALFSSSCFSA